MSHLLHALLIALVIGGQLAIAGRDRRALVVQAFLSALERSDLTAKDAMFYMGLDPSQYSRTLDPHGSLQLSAYRLAAMPFKFQMEYIALYASLVLRESAKEIAEDVALARSR